MNYKSLNFFLQGYYSYEEEINLRKKKAIAEGMIDDSGNASRFVEDDEESKPLLTKIL
jgi:hypothetical protein